jgi:hypothetical protein
VRERVLTSGPGERSDLLRQGYGGQGAPDSEGEGLPQNRRASEC